jgi:hypothetical protein
LQKDLNIIKAPKKLQDKEVFLRVLKALKMFNTGCVKLEKNGLYAQIQSASNPEVVWISDLTKFRCTCLHNLHKGVRCKHQLSHLMAYARDNLGKSEKDVGLFHEQLYIGEEVFGPKVVFQDGSAFKLKTLTTSMNIVEILDDDTAETVKTVDKILDNTAKTDLIQMKERQIQELQTEVVDLQIQQEYTPSTLLIDSIQSSSSTTSGRPISKLPPAKRNLFLMKKKPGSGRRNKLTGEKLPNKERNVEKERSHQSSLSHNNITIIPRKPGRPKLVRSSNY